MTRSRLCASLACALLIAGVSSAAFAQDRSPGLLDNLFGRGQQQQQQPPQQPPPQQQPDASPPPMAQGGGGGGNDVDSRMDRIENALRQLTGSMEQLQHQNQVLQMQLKRMQDDTEYRFQQLGSRGGAPMAAPQTPQTPMPPPGAQPADNGRRGDAFNPSQNPNAPGVPRTLGNPQAAASPMPSNPPIMNEPGGAQAGAQAGAQVGVPGGRDAGAPLDLSTLAGNPPQPQAPAPSNAGVPAPMNAPQGASMAPPQAAPLPAPQTGQLPPPPPRNTSATGVQLATLPPGKSPKDEYELAYGYVLHKDYGLAEQAFRDFIRKYPNEKLLPDAQYWLGETQFQQQRYRDAAESFLAVSTKYEHSGKAPDALLRLGQSLAELHQKEAACATLAEVGRKFPRAAATVKRSVAREQKRAHC